MGDGDCETVAVPEALLDAMRADLCANALDDGAPNCEIEGRLFVSSVPCWKPL